MIYRIDSPRLEGEPEKTMKPLGPLVSALACASALGGFVISPTLAVAKEAKSVLVPVVPEATRPLIILSFIAGVGDADARPAARQYAALNIGKVQGSMHLREGALQAVIAKTALWVPYYYASLERRLGVGSVILDPLVMKRGADGRFVLTSEVEGAIAPYRQLLMAYQMPYDDGSGSPVQPSSRGQFVVPATLPLTAALMPDRVADWSAVAAAANSAWVKAKAEKVVTPTFMAAIGTPAPKPASLTVLPLDAIAETTAKSVRPLAGDAVPRLKAYRAILGFPEAGDLDFRFSRPFLTGETKFRRTRSDALVDYLQNSEYATSVKDAAREEDTAIRQQRGSMFMMLLGAVASNASGFANGGAASQEAIAFNNTAIENMARMQSSAVGHQGAMAGLSMQQVSLGTTEIAGAQSVSASSVDDLRARFRAIFARQSVAK